MPAVPNPFLVNRRPKKGDDAAPSPIDDDEAARKRENHSSPNDHLKPDEKQ